MTVVDPSAVSIGLDAAIVAAHQVAIRGPGIREDFKVAPTLAGLARLSERRSSTTVLDCTSSTRTSPGTARRQNELIRKSTIRGESGTRRHRLPAGGQSRAGTGRWEAA